MTTKIVYDHIVSIHYTILALLWRLSVVYRPAPHVKSDFRYEKISLLRVGQNGVFLNLRVEILNIVIGILKRHLLGRKDVFYANIRSAVSVACCITEEPRNVKTLNFWLFRWRALSPLQHYRAAGRECDFDCFFCYAINQFSA